jgi:outer membrane immunogenic protein
VWPMGNVTGINPPDVGLVGGRGEPLGRTGRSGLGTTRDVYKMMKIAGAALAASLLVGGVGAAHAADLIVDQTVAPVVYDDVASSNWAGPYLGVSVGYGAGTVEYTGDLDGEYDVDGWQAGLQAGVLGQSGSFVYGVEGTINWADLSGTSGPVDGQMNWNGSLVGKAGFAVDSILFYGLAGLAFANGTGTYGGEDVTNTHTGWTAGLGIAAKVTDDMSVFAEYDYADYGAKNYSYIPGDADSSFTTSTIKVGLNWHF